MFNNLDDADASVGVAFWDVSVVVVSGVMLIESFLRIAVERVEDRISVVFSFDTIASG